MLSRDLDADKKKKVLRSMIFIAVLAVSAGIVTNLVTQYTRGQDPLYQCIDSDNLPYQAYVTVFVNIDRQPVEVPADIGINDDCLRPIHTHDNSGLIHIAFDRSYEFRLGHFLWYWNFNIQEYDAKVYVNGIEQEKYLGTVLRDGMSIIMEFNSKSKGLF